MVNWQVDITDPDSQNTQQVQQVFDVKHNSGSTDELGKATVTCANTSTNRGFQSGDEVKISENSEEIFRGYLTGKPTSQGGGRNTSLEIEVVGRRLELKHQQISRVFYNMDSGKIIEESVNKEIRPLSEQFATTGDSLTNWDGDVPTIQLGKIPEQQLHEAGYDFVFLGWPAATSSDVYSVTFDNVESSSIPGDGQISKIKVRMAINNGGQQFAVEVNLRDNAGNDYNWHLGRPRSSDFQEYELPAEEAKTEATIGSKTTTNGSLQFRFKLKGRLPEPRAAAIDYVKTVPFALSNRQTVIQPNDVRTTDRKVTRRIDRSIFELIKEFSTEDQFISYLDNNDSLHYEPSGQQQSDLSIEESGNNATPVVEAEFKRDYRDVINKVSVTGANEVSVTLTDTASVDFYGVSPREEPIYDEEIQTEEEATSRGRGYLQKNAWNDTAMKFVIGDNRFARLTYGNEIFVDWPTEDVIGTYGVSSVEEEKNGLVTIGLTSTEAI